MIHGISEKEGRQAVSQEFFLEKLRRFFSDGLYLEIKRIFGSCGVGERVEEIRLRCGRCAYLTIGAGALGKKRNVSTDIFLSSDELSCIFEKMCDGSLYAYSESIIKGYISLPSGMRVGVCGKAAVEKEKIFGVYDISALNIRIPCVSISTDAPFLDIVRKNLRIGQGILIFSPPAQGKTTCLRSLAYELASGDDPMRVSVVDTRGELSFMPDNPKLSLDMLIGYPKAEGIRISTLFMNPEVIICDEIGTDEEARAIADAQNCGVPLIASVHGATLESVMLKRGITTLHNACAFGVYVSLRIGMGGRLTYGLYSREEADKALENNRLAHNNF
jgi:stage III sporulation protein AA